MLLDALRSPFGTLLPLTGAFFVSALKGFNPATLFSSGQPGAWYDPSEAISAPWFQDSAGTAPVTAVEQPVGRAIDKSGRSNHLLQATAAARSRHSARVNLLTKSEDFADVYWPKNGVTVTNNAATAPDGTTTAALFAGTAVNGFHTLSSSAFTAALAVDCSRRVSVKASGCNFVRLLSQDNVDSPEFYVNLLTGAVGTTGVGITGIVVTNKLNGWWEIEWHKVTASALNYFGVSPSKADNDSAFFAGNGTDGILVWHPQAVIGSTLGKYQRANTATDYDTAGFPFFEVSDGIDDSAASAAGGGATAGFFLCRAIKPTGGAGTVRTLWSDAGVNTGYLVQINLTNQLQLSAGNGTAFTVIAASGATAIGTTSLLTVWDDGTNLNAQLDSGTIATIARPVVAAGTAGFTEGKDNGAATGFFTGNMYAEIYRTGTPVSASERASIQSYCRTKAGLP